MLKSQTVSVLPKVPSKNQQMKRKLEKKLKDPKSFLRNNEQSSFQVSSTQSTKLYSAKRADHKSMEYLTKKSGASNMGLNNTMESSIGNDIDKSIGRAPKTSRILETQRRSLEYRLPNALAAFSAKPIASFN
jgi:hypothetical protein